ncbi:MAG TPA: hypothetical protein PKZ84_23925 [Anaerolineae bacterium]|nr:hypothetical protein [Anaerolineae bacterium]HQI87664.1 hypothetical protein [Anaerolineae bacterium]
MRERAEQVGGTLEVRSAPGEGTRLLLTVPRFVPTVEDADGASLQHVRLLLADDHPLFLDGLRNLLVARGLNVIGVAHDGNEVQEKARATPRRGGDGREHAEVRRVDGHPRH